MMAYVFNVCITGQSTSVIPQIDMHDDRWYRLGGLVNFRDGEGGSARSLGEQALILFILASLQVMQHILTGARLPTRGAWYYTVAADALQRTCEILQALNQPETSMLVTLGLLVVMFSCEGGHASLLMMAYVTLLVMLIGSGASQQRKDLRRKLWLGLHSLAEAGSIFVMLVYVMGGAVDALLSGDFSVITVANCTHLHGLMLPHVGIFLTAGLQYMCLSEDASSLMKTATTTTAISRKLRWHVLSKFGIKGVRILRRRLKKFFGECMFLVVMNLSVVTALMAPTDIHSLALLGIVGPSLLLHNMERPPRCCNKVQTREWHELGVMRITQYFSLTCMLIRTAVTAKIFPLPSRELQLVTLEELGLIHELEDPPAKYVLLGCTAIVARLAANMLSESMREDLERGLIGSHDDNDAIIAQSEWSPDGADDAIPDERGIDISLSETSPSEPPGEPSDGTASSPVIGSSTPPLRAPVADETMAVEGSEKSPCSQYSTEKTTFQPKCSMSRPEERFLEKWAPSWMPVQAHSYLSILLLFVSFVVSDNENHLLNFLMILAVVLLCGWHKYWVRVGDVFAVTTVLIMIVQYVFRFQRWHLIMGEAWIDQVGLRWTPNQVVRHYTILVLCFLQKDLYFRGRNSKVREPTCPQWLSRHADIVGVFVLLLVAVLRRHAWATVMAVAVFPWLVHEEPAYYQYKNGVDNRSRTKWLCFFRFVLLGVLLFQLTVRLGIAFKIEEHLRPVFSGVCSNLWEESRIDECITEWHKWTKISAYENNNLFWDFFALFVLGYIQQLLPHTHLQEHGEAAEGEGLPGKKHRWKLLTMFWWPCMVWLPLFVLSFEGGTLLGICNLAMLFGVIFSADGTLALRKRWVWRARFCAWVFLVFGLFAQSPAAPCSVASCKNHVHNTFMPHETCLALQNLNNADVATEAQMRECETGGGAWGHDTPSTMMLQVVGLKRVSGESISGGLSVLFGSQLGWLLLVIFSATVQLRIFGSLDYGEELEEPFITEQTSVRFQRALRFVHECHCRGALEKNAQQQRHRALRSKLKRIMKRVNAILNTHGTSREQQGFLGSPGAAGTRVAGSRDDTSEGVNRDRRQTTDRTQIAIEEVQTRQGVTKGIADNVTYLFHDDVHLSNQYLYILDKVAIGRIQPYGEFLRQLVYDLAEGLKDNVEESHAARVRTESGSSEPSVPTEQCSEPVSKSGLVTCIRKSKVFVKQQRDALLRWWESFKCSPYLASWMWDYAWLGVVEEDFRVKDAEGVSKEELHEHRQNNSPFRVLWKLVLSNTMSLVGVASVISFIETRCILDFLRVTMVFFVALRSHPCPPRAFWTVLKVFSSTLLIFRTFYNMPFFCSGFGVRTPMQESYREANYPWEPKLVIEWCPALFSAGFDVTFGIAKRIGPSALHSQSWFAAVWADHLCIWLTVAHQWMLARSGCWDYVTVDSTTQHLIICPKAVKSMGSKAHEKASPTGRYTAVDADSPTHKAWRRACSPRSPAGSSQPSSPGSADVGDEEDLEVAEELHAPVQLRPAFGENAAVSGRVAAKPWSRASRSCDLSEFGSLFRVATHYELLRFYVARRNIYTRRADEWMLRLQRQHQQPADEESIDIEADHSMESVASQDAMQQTPQEAEVGDHTTPSFLSVRHNAIWRHSASSSTSSSNSHTSNGSHGSHGVWEQIGLPKFFSLNRRVSREGLGMSKRAQAVLAAYSAAAHNREELQKKVKAAISIQKHVRQWQRRRQQRNKIRCSMGHPLEHYFSNRKCAHQGNGVMNSQLKADGEICEICYRTIQLGEGTDREWWACLFCEYYACKSCVDNLVSRGLSIGAKKEVTKSYMRQGMSLYWFKFACGLFLLLYGMWISDTLVQDERSFSESVQSSSFGLKTVALFIIHLSLLIGDRIWHKLYYRCLNSSENTRMMLDWSYSFLHLTLCVLLHTFIMMSLDNNLNTRDVQISLGSKPRLCLYYVVWILYLAACMVQHRHGLPAVDTDLLRPSQDPEEQGFFSEKLRTFYFLLHYQLPFVDDLRVIIDWSVVRTSLDLWMYFKVEDAHSFLFKTRHTMFVRRQSFFAEERDWTEKLCTGWLLLAVLLFVILMPIIVFSPITPFPNSVPITLATVNLQVTIASACTNSLQSCDIVEVPLFQAPAQRYVSWKDRKDLETWYFSANPQTGTDVDLQEVSWGPHSSTLFSVAPPTAIKVAEMLDNRRHDTQVMVVFRREFHVQQEGSQPVVIKHNFCALSSAFEPSGLQWPNAMLGCRGGVDLFNFTRDWWAVHAFDSDTGAGSMPLELPQFWTPSIKLRRGGQYEALKRVTIREESQRLQELYDGVNFTMANSRDLCQKYISGNATELAGRKPPPSKWCESTTHWGMLEMQGNQTLRILFEIEKGAQISESTGSWGSVLGLYAGLVVVVGRYLRTAFQDSSKRAVYEEIPDVGVFLDLVTAIQLAREHGDLRTEFQLYYELMKVLRSTDLLLTSGRHEVQGYGVFRVDTCPAECIEPGWRGDRGLAALGSYDGLRSPPRPVDNLSVSL